MKVRKLKSKMDRSRDVYFSWKIPILGTLLFLFSYGCSFVSTGDNSNGSQVILEDDAVVTSESFPLAPKAVPLDEPLGSSKGTPKELGAVWEAWALLNRDHLDKANFDAKEFEEFAIKGLIAAVDDPHTSYVQPEVLSIEKENLSGQFEGIGAHVRRRRRSCGSCRYQSRRYHCFCQR